VTRDGPRTKAQGPRTAITGAVCVSVALFAASCASRTAPIPSAPVAIAHGEFVYPAVPPALQKSPGADLIDVGWRYLQGDNAAAADRTFGFALRRNAKLYPARAGLGYVALARRDLNRALSTFNEVLTTAPGYAPALAGRGEALLALGRQEEALTALERALAADATLADVRRRVDVLRFRSLQDAIEAAREAARSGREADARAAYLRALTASPDSPFLLREIGLLDRKSGHPDDALEEFKRATALDPNDTASLIQIGELLHERGDYAGAEAAYRQAADIEPSPELAARLVAAAKNAREAKLPAEFLAALTAPQLTRGELAAIIGVRLADLVREARERQVVVTDTRGHWAAEWIGPVARAGIMDPFANHTFQPRTRVRRGDLATAVSGLLALIAARDPDVRARLEQRPTIADLTPRHTQYRAVAAAVGSGVMPLLAGDRFQVAQPVSGVEAVEAIDRVRALAARTQQLPVF
jgi:tetratricopeptide (TPR) repeat protein